LSRVQSLRTKTQKKKYLKELMEAEAIRPEVYDIKKSYEVGDFVNHPKYGDGFIEEIMTETKMRIFFIDSERVFIHSKG
jgi:hypothetical protein